MSNGMMSRSFAIAKSLTTSGYLSDMVDVSVCIAVKLSDISFPHDVRFTQQLHNALLLCYEHRFFLIAKNIRLGIISAKICKKSTRA
ncbi:4070_t:CDS:2 [Ambispora gerdemannii]|uniref:4070_t:CDS:1 n=1 Tax=Ambispora gerdemannii TaxID=144530 RepID=A0A9N9F7X5_9GLOM|nr:4070_t:CDS:2 [Ambispora gerdemannii]